MNDLDSLRLALEAEKHNHRRDNELLLGRAEAAEKERDEYLKQRNYDYKRFAETKAALIAAETRLAELRGRLAAAHRTEERDLARIANLEADPSPCLNCGSREQTVVCANCGRLNPAEETP